MRTLSFALIGAACAALSTSALAFDESAPPEKREAAGFDLPANVPASALPLRAQSTTIEIAGVLARIHIEQTWENAGDKPLDVNYVFPASTRSALHDLRLQIGDTRELRAEIHAKEEAQKLYDAARDEGKTAGLLEQQRPNVLTMHLANVMPGDRIKVTIEASEIARATDGVYELALPQTVGPRYMGNVGSEPLVQNQYVAASSPAAQALTTALHVTLRSPTGIYGVGSPSHGVAPRFTSAHEALIDVVSGADDVVADRDFVLRWRLAQNKVETGVLLFRDKDNGEGFFLLLGAPPPRIDAREAPPREVIFVVDVSGSMSGFPLDTAKKLVGNLAGELRDSDRFNMVFFSGGNHVFSPSGSVAANRANIERAYRELERERGGGGTELLHALDTAFDLPRGDVDGVPRARLVVVVTDGFIGAEGAAFDLVRQKRGDATVVSFGVGSSVNRQLIEGLANAGGTESFVVLDESQGKRAVEHFRTVTSRPALTNVDVSFQGFEATDLEPPQAPDLYAGRPLVMLGRYTGPASGRVVIAGDGVGERRYENTIAIEDNLEQPAHAVLRPLWARERVARLADRATPSAADLAEVERLGIRYRILTERTAFVVVDPTVRNEDVDHNERVDQPSVAPRGVDAAASGAAMYGKKTVLNFSGANVEGQLVKPDGAYLLGVRKRVRSEGILGVLPMSPSRDSFGAGGFGLGTRGGGAGGGGGLGLSASGYGRGARDASASAKGETRVVPGEIVYEGSLARDDVKRPITRVMAQIKYCYEKELVREPTLAGKLVLRWSIAGDGGVKDLVIERNTVGADARGVAVGACVSRVISRVRFPAPKGGGEVRVSYPFVFAHDEG